MYNRELLDPLLRYVVDQISLGARPEPIHLLQRNHICTLNRINDPAEVDLAITALAELNVVGHYLNHAYIVVFEAFTHHYLLSTDSQNSFL